MYKPILDFFKNLHNAYKSNIHAKETEDNLTKRLGATEQELEKERDLRLEAERRAKFHAENAAYHQNRAQELNPSIIIPEYLTLISRLKKTKQPLLVLSPGESTILYVPESVTKKPEQLVGASFNKLLEDSSYLPGSSRFLKKRINLAGHVYEPNIKTHKNFRIVKLRPVGSLEKIMEKIQSAVEKRMKKPIRAREKF